MHDQGMARNQFLHVLVMVAYPLYHILLIGRYSGVNGKYSCLKLHIFLNKVDTDYHLLLKMVLICEYIDPIVVLGCHINTWMQQTEYDRCRSRINKIVSHRMGSYSYLLGGGGGGQGGQ